MDDDLSAHGAPASPDALRQIVARHRRTRTRTLGVALAVALVAGPAAGWAIGHSGGGGQQVATGSPADRSAAAPQANNNDNTSAAASAVGGSAEAFAIAGPNGPKLTHLFTRTSSDGIVIRAYRAEPPPQPQTQPQQKPSESPSAKGQAPPANGQAPPCPQPFPGRAGVSRGVVSSGSGSATASASASSGETGNAVSGEPAPDQAPPPCPPMPPPCKAGPSVVAEASNDAAVGQSFDPSDDKQPTDALSHVVARPFGGPEGSPSLLVTAQTGANVANVRLRLPSGATDEMAPVNGVVVLAHGASQPPADGTVVEALDSNGKVLASTPVNEPGPKTAMACAMAGPPLMVKPAPPRESPPTTR